jgi:hypothetical protein
MLTTKTFRFTIFSSSLARHHVTVETYTTTSAHTVSASLPVAPAIAVSLTITAHRHIKNSVPAGTAAELQ